MPVQLQVDVERLLLLVPTEVLLAVLISAPIQVDAVHYIALVQCNKPSW
jgi:hypothetical protein